MLCVFKKRGLEDHFFKDLNVAETEAMFRKFLRSLSKIASVDIYDNYKTEDCFFFVFVFFLMMR